MLRIMLTNTTSIQNFYTRCVTHRGLPIPEKRHFIISKMPLPLPHYFGWDLCMKILFEHHFPYGKGEKREEGSIAFSSFGRKERRENAIFLQP